MSLRGLYQPYFISGVALVTMTWAIAGFLNRGGIRFPIVGASTFLFAVIASLPVFSVWKLSSKCEKRLFFGSYLAWLLLAPLVWIALHRALLLSYAYVVTRCCEHNAFLQTTVWESLSSLRESDLTVVAFSGLFLYLSLWLSVNTKGIALLRRSAQVLTFVSLVYFVLMLLVAFSEI